MRLEMYRDKLADKPHAGVIYLHRSKFRQWLASKGVDSKSVFDHIDYRGLDRTPPGGRVLFGKDTSLKIAQERVLGVSMDCPELVGMLSDMDNALTERQLSKLKLVGGAQ